jgi:hypothetical protein
MAIASVRTVEVAYSGDVTLDDTHVANNATSPGMEELKTLASGANTITVPVVSGFAVTGVTIVPPAGNAVALTLKGVTGDTGVRIHNTDPTSLGLDSAVVSFCLTAGSSVAGVRFYWT